MFSYITNLFNQSIISVDYIKYCMILRCPGVHARVGNSCLINDFCVPMFLGVFSKPAQHPQGFVLRSVPAVTVDWLRLL